MRIIYVGFQHAILTASKLAINIGKTYIMKCITNNSSHSTLCVGYIEVYRRDCQYEISWFTNSEPPKVEEPY